MWTIPSLSPIAIAFTDRPSSFHFPIYMRQTPMPLISSFQYFHKRTAQNGWIEKRFYCSISFHFALLDGSINRSVRPTASSQFRWPFMVSWIFILTSIHIWRLRPIRIEFRTKVFPLHCMTAVVCSSRPSVFFPSRGTPSDPTNNK